MRLRKSLSVLLALVSVLAILLVCTILTGGCGLHIYDPSKACNGYTLVCNQNSVVRLIDMGGKTVNTWTTAGFPAKLFPNGSLLAEGGHNVVAFEMSEVVQLNWAGETEWDFSAFDEVEGEMVARVHHDVQKVGNPVGYYAPGQEPQPYGADVLVLGRVDALVPEISDKALLDDVVYEVDWETKEFNVIWTLSEHFDEFGFDEEAKQLIYDKGGDYLHINSVSWVGPNKWYDPDTGEGDARFHPDNLIIDSREANVIWIVNMAEDTGYEVGEIVWQVGPDYGPGTPAGDNLGQIIGQHHAHMIPEGLPGAGNILVFDNGGVAGYPTQYRWYSRILEFDPVTLELVWSYEDDPKFFSVYISSVQRLPNGNTLIDEGATGRVFEVTPAGEIVWEFVEGTGIPMLGRVYRAYRVPPEWVPGNPSGYTPWSELYEGSDEGGESESNGEPAAGGEGTSNAQEPAIPLEEPKEPLPEPI